MPDIDIDFADRSILLDKVKHRIAKLDSGKKHNIHLIMIKQNKEDILK